MDESGGKSGNTSGSLKRRRSQLAGWLAVRERGREEGKRGGRSSNNERNFSFTVGWKIDGGVWLAWKITAGFADRPFQTFDHASSFFIRYSFIRAHCLPHNCRPTYPQNKTPYVIFPSFPLRIGEEIGGAGSKRAFASFGSFLERVD